MWAHVGGDEGDDRDNDAVAKLLVGLRVGHRDTEGVRETHEARTFTWRQSAWVLTTPTVHEDFRSVLVVASRKGARDVVLAHKSETEAVAGGSVLGRIAL